MTVRAAKVSFEKLNKSFALSIDDDDDDEDDSSSQTVSQPAQQAVQQIASSPISSDEPAAVADEVVADNIDDVANTNVDGQTDIVDTDAKDPQQAAQDQAATINNNIDPVGNEAIVDDEDGKFWNIFLCWLNNYHGEIFTDRWRRGRFRRCFGWWR